MLRGGLLKRKRAYNKFLSGGGFCVILLLFLCCCFLGLLLGMCERVRTRNTLHEVGACGGVPAVSKKREKVIKCEK